MVYNRDSLYFHLYTAYERRIVHGLFAGLTPDEAFARNPDGPDCPVSRAFRPAQFCELTTDARFSVEYLGGYFAELELELWRTLGAEAVEDPRLGGEHRDFLRQVESDADGYPRFTGTTRVWEAFTRSGNPCGEHGRSNAIDEQNKAFWDELCGTGLARSLGITEITPASIARFDDAYMQYYPYLARYLDDLTVEGRRCSRSASASAPSARSSPRAVPAITARTSPPDR